jgi:hypothetical protein
VRPGVNKLALSCRLRLEAGLRVPRESMGNTDARRIVFEVAAMWDRLAEKEEAREARRLKRTSPK